MNLSVWNIEDYFIDKTLRFDITCSLSHSIREKNAATHTLAAKLEWYSKDSDHWTIKADSTGVSMHLVSHDAEEKERALYVKNTALYSMRIK